MKMKRFSLILAMICLLAALFVLSAGAENSIVCDQDHSYSVSVALVSAQDDPRGIGYELLQCENCTEILKKQANHKSGHCFENGECVCGTKVVEAYTEAVSDLTTECRISDINAQPSFNVASTDLAATDIDKVRLSVKFKYTGDPRESDGRSTKDYFFSWRFNTGSVMMVNVYLDLSGEKAKLSMIDEIELDADTYYTVTFDGVVGTKAITITVTPEGGEAVTLGVATIRQELSTSWRLYTRPMNIGYSSDASTFAMYVKDLSVGTVKGGVDESNMVVSPCEHDFWAEPVVDAEHPASGDWYKATCALCDGYYYEQGCRVLGHIKGELLADKCVAPTCTEKGKNVYSCLVCGDDVNVEVSANGHKWSDTPIANKHVAPTCTEKGKDVYPCTVCGEELEVELALADHTLTEFIAISATGGYETWGCENCSYTQNITGNHASGHFFENGKCKCGAKVAETYTEVISNLTTERRISDTNGQPSFTVSSADLAAADAENVRLSIKFKYTGDPRESDGSSASKKDTFFSWRFNSGMSGAINVNLDLSGEKAKLYMGSNEVTLEADTYYTVTFDGIVSTNAVTVTVTPEGGEAVTLGKATASQGLSTSWLLFTRVGNIGYSADASTFAMYLKDLSVGTAKASGVDTTDMMAPKYDFIYSGTCGANGDNLIWGLNKNGELIIRGEGEMADYDWNSAPWYSYREQIKKVTIEEGVTSIGDFAVNNCASLTEVSISDSVTSIGSCVFMDCESLAVIHIPKGVTRIDNSAFFYCPSLASITVDQDNAVYHSAGNCLILTESKMLVVGCQTSVIPTDGSVTVIGNGAFFRQDRLSKIVIPDTVTSIQDQAFAYCEALTELHIPASVDELGYNPFRASGVTSITVDTGNPTFYVAEGCLMEKETGRLIGGFGNCSIPADGSVKSIDDGAFERGQITSAVIPQSVKSIGFIAFANCKSLETITIHSASVEIYDDANTFPENATIYAPAGSTAEAYAKKYNRSFVEIALLGDVNGDGKVNSNDAIYLLRYTLQPSRYPLNQGGDMNGDGKVDSNDAIYLLRHIFLPSRYPLYST